MGFIIVIYVIPLVVNLVMFFSRHCPQVKSGFMSQDDYMTSLFISFVPLLNLIGILNLLIDRFYE